MSRRIWFVTILLGLFYTVAWALSGNWFYPAARQAALRLLVEQAGLCLLGFLLWGAFYAQFILPLQTVHHRFQAIIRLFLHLFGRHGPAIFIENGVPREHAGEEEKEGPGLIWLDTASGTVLRSKSRFTRVIGPGIHFTSRNETIGGTVDLRTQNQMIGPRRGDDPFAEPPSDPNDEAARLSHQEALRRANETLAYTADHQAIVPNIIVIFKIKSQPVSGAQPGSRFGFDEDAVFKAVTSTMVDLEQEGKGDMVHWNEIPAYIAADIWREMLGKYQFNELFQPLPFDPGPDHPPADDEGAAAPQEAAPVRRSALREYLADLDRWLAHQAHILNLAFFPLKETDAEDDCRPPDAPPRPNSEMTVLEFIQRIMKQRLSMPKAQEIDDQGRPTGRWHESTEYRQMEDLGIQVRTVIVTNLRFAPEVELDLVTNWADQWLQRARQRAREIDDYLANIAQETRQQATIEFSEHLARRINRAARFFLKKSGEARTRHALSSALEATYNYLTGNDRLRQALRHEIEKLKEIQRQVSEADLEQESPQ